MTQPVKFSHDYIISQELFVLNIIFTTLRLKTSPVESYGPIFFPFPPETDCCVCTILVRKQEHGSCR